jgi:hypothetical protein
MATAAILALACALALLLLVPAGRRANDRAWIARWRALQARTPQLTEAGPRPAKLRRSEAG